MFYQVMKMIGSLECIGRVLFLSKGNRGGGDGDNIQGQAELSVVIRDDHERIMQSNH